jgi:hypothetical protein
LTDDVIALLNDKFVPFAPRFGGTKDKDEWWKVNARKCLRNSSPCFIPGIQFWVVTSTGEPVPAKKAKYSKKAGFAPTLKQVLQLYAQMPQSQRRPDQPIPDANLPEPAPPPGGLVLVSFDRPLRRDEDGRYRSLTGPDCQKNLRKYVPSQPGAQRDALWLTSAECQSLMPQNPKKGQTFSVPSPLTRRIGLFGLTVRSAWQEVYRWQPDSVRQGELQLTVESVSPTEVRMRIHGCCLLSSITKKWRPEGTTTPPRDLLNRYDAHLEGKLVYDPTRQRITSWDMVALGDYIGFSQAHAWIGPKGTKDYEWTKEPIAIAMSFEIDRTNYVLPAEYRRTIPYLIYRFHHKDERQYYFDPDKWEADWKKHNKK